MGLFDKLKAGLSKTRNTIQEGLEDLFGGFGGIDDDFYDELLEILVMADMGVGPAQRILDDLKARVKEAGISEPEKVKELLIDTIIDQMRPDEHAWDFEDEKSVVLLVGVNGVGKTTSVGKLGINLSNKGRAVILAAADTFRAAAIEQLQIWAERGNLELVAQKEGSDPASVVYDALQAFKNRNKDVLIADTAGRLHNKKNLMDELGKISRIIEREAPDLKKETLLVLDATTGQNALSQAREFLSVCEPTGIILTKMDGTAKGGIAVAVESELKVPVKYIGVGEAADDLQRFDAESYVRALFE